MPADIVIENANGDTLEKLDSGDNTRLATLKDALGGRGKLRKKSDKVLKINPNWIVEPGTYVWSPDEQQQANGKKSFGFGCFLLLNLFQSSFANHRCSSATTPT